VLATGCGGDRSIRIAAPVVLAPGLVRETSGLLVSKPFRSPESTGSLRREFELDGSAPAADAWARVDASGLSVGVRRHRPGVFEGYFAVTRAAYPATSVFHVQMSRERGTVASSTQTGESVFAVQTGTTKQTGAINYVVVASVTNAGMTHWEVGYAEGHLADARTTILWASPATRDAPLSEDVTLRTDGRSSLVVYLGSRLVYQSDRLAMRIVAPFQPYLEVQALEIPYAARFQDFWITRDSSLLVTGLSRGDEVTLSTAAGAEVDAVADASGQARLGLPLPSARGSGTLAIEHRGSQRRFPGLTYAGGDVLRVG
jgi:hypothetical protein